MSILTKKVKLNNGIEMPVFGLGTYLMTKESESLAAITYAIDHGYELIDTAEVYENSKMVAKAIKNSKKNRRDLFITSKIGVEHHSYEDTKKVLAQLFKELETDYLDMVLVHFPTSKALDCWKALEEAYYDKKIHAIGVSNFPKIQLNDFIKKVTVKPVVNQIEMNINLNRGDIVSFCEEQNIVITSWETLGKGKCLINPAVMEISKKYGKSPAQVCLKWALQMGVTVIPKSNNPKHIMENALVDDFIIDDSDMFTLLTQPQGEVCWWYPNDGTISQIPWSK